MALLQVDFWVVTRHIVRVVYLFAVDMERNALLLVMILPLA